MTAPARAIGAHTDRQPALRAVPPAPADRRSRATSVALYSAGLVIGFLLAALASAPGGSAVVTWQLGLAGVAATVCLLAARRARTDRRATRTAPRVGEARTPHREFRRAA